MQELVDDSSDIRVSPELQHLVGYDEDLAEEENGTLTKKMFEIHSPPNSIVRVNFARTLLNHQSCIL